MTILQSGRHLLRRTLAEVDVALVATVRQLERDWVEVAGRASDILGEHDLPQLIRQANRGGKRIRPTMVHWGWVAAGADERVHDDIVTLGVALELLHLFALVHDDVMDRSEQRRGRPAVHATARDAHRRSRGRDSAVEFGNSIAVLVGDLAHSEADHLVSGLPLRVRGVWRQMMIELVLGQRRDLTGAALGRRDLAHALEIARLKTGSYTVERPLQMGAVLGGADAEQLGRLARYGAHIGRAFGLRDDILGMWGDPAMTGKPSGDDLAAGKATVLLALAADRLSDVGRMLLAQAGSGELTDTGFQRLYREMAGCGIREEAEQLIAGEVEQACAELSAGRFPTEAIYGLSEMADTLAWRQA